MPETLLEAVELGDLKRLRELIKSGADVNESQEDMPLWKAAESGRADMVRELLKAGADADCGGLHVPLCAAAHCASAEIVDLLLNAGAKVDAQEEGGESALMCAAAKGDLKIVKRLLKAGADPKLQDEDGGTAIIYAKRWPKVIECLKPLSSPEDVEFLANEARKIAAEVEQLLSAAAAGDTLKVKKLLDAGVPVDGANKEEETALHIAVSKQNEKLLELLLKAGANVDARNRYGRTPLWEAAGSRDLKLVERLIQAGADVNAREKIEGKSPFLNSIGPKEEHRDMMRLLARHGADVKAIDNYGRTALGLADRYLGNSSYADKEELKNAAALREVFTELGLLHTNANEFVKAAGRGDVKSVCRLLEEGTPADTVDEQERTALYMAISRQHPEVIQQLLKAGVDVHKAIGQDNEQDVQWGGRACTCPSCGIVFTGILIERTCPKCGKSFSPQKKFGPRLGGKLFFTWSNGHLPLMTAARMNNAEIASLLIGAGADVNRGKDGLSPMMVASYFGHIEVARVLVEHGADAKHGCKTPDQLKETISPVFLAAREKHLAMVNFLWESGVPAQDKKPTLLVAAAERGDAKEIAKLVGAGADPNAQDPLTGEWPLGAAAHAGQVAGVEALLKAGAIANPTGRQMAPLFTAVSALEHKKRQEQATPDLVQQYVTVAKILLVAGAKANASCFGVSPLSMAEDMECKPLVDVLKAAAPEATK